MAGQPGKRQSQLGRSVGYRQGSLGHGEDRVLPTREGPGRGRSEMNFGPVLRTFGHRREDVDRCSRVARFAFFDRSSDSTTSSTPPTTTMPHPRPTGRRRARKNPASGPSSRVFRPGDPARPSPIPVTSGSVTDRSSPTKVGTMPPRRYGEFFVHEGMPNSSSTKVCAVL